MRSNNQLSPVRHRMWSRICITIHFLQLNFSVHLIGKQLSQNKSYGDRLYIQVIPMKAVLSDGLSLDTTFAHTVCTVSATLFWILFLT